MNTITLTDSQLILLIRWASAGIKSLKVEESLSGSQLAESLCDKLLEFEKEATSRLIERDTTNQVSAQ